MYNIYCKPTLISVRQFLQASLAFANITCIETFIECLWFIIFQVLYIRNTNIFHHELVYIQ